MSELENLALAVGQLADGWRERIEYAVIIAGRTEERARTVKQEALLLQLRRAVAMPSPRERTEIPSPNVTGGSHPGNLAASDLLLRIGAESLALRTSLLCRLGQRERKRPSRAPETVLRSLVGLAAEVDDREALSEALGTLRGHVREARVILAYERPMRMLTDTVCGACSGALVVAADADSDVRCIGSPDAPACGMIYRKWQWFELLGAG